MQSGERYEEPAGEGFVHSRRKRKGAWAVYYQYYAGISDRVTAQDLYIHNPSLFPSTRPLGDDRSVGPQPRGTGWPAANPGSRVRLSRYPTDKPLRAVAATKFTPQFLSVTAE